MTGYVNYGGVGIDIPNVRMVIHLGGMCSLCDFAQESGRAGRDGQPALSIVIHNSFDTSGQPQITSQERQLVDYYNTMTCRRLVLSVFLDGAGGDCYSNPDNMLCDLCEKKSLRDAEEVQKAVHVNSTVSVSILAETRS